MRTLVAMSLLLLSAAPAAAKPADKPVEDEEAWREHHRRGTMLFDLSQFDDAIAEFTQAYEIRNEPILLYEIAQSMRLSHRYREAARFYRTYLLRAPKASNRGEVEGRIVEMDR